MTLVRYLGMRLAREYLAFYATFAVRPDRIDAIRNGVITLAETAPSRREFLAGLEALARAEHLVLELGHIERDEVGFYLWDPAGLEPQRAQ